MTVPVALRFPQSVIFRPPPATSVPLLSLPSVAATPHFGASPLPVPPHRRRSTSIEPVRHSITCASHHIPPPASAPLSTHMDIMHNADAHHYLSRITACIMYTSQFIDVFHLQRGGVTTPRSSETVKTFMSNIEREGCHLELEPHDVTYHRDSTSPSPPGMVSLRPGPESLKARTLHRSEEIMFWLELFSVHELLLRVTSQPTLVGVSD